VEQYFHAPIRFLVCCLVKHGTLLHVGVLSKEKGKHLSYFTINMKMAVFRTLEVRATLALLHVES
jgi:hypothetical protein